MEVFNVSVIQILKKSHNSYIYQCSQSLLGSSHPFVISFSSLFATDELDCKMSATPLADLDKAEWNGDTLYIIIGQHPSS